MSVAPTSTESQRPVTGIVVIGRNEGSRLLPGFEVLAKQTRPVVYVDSGSTDDSVALARPYCARVVELDPSRPFSAARARNEGAEALRALDANLQHVQFLDGDCVVQPGWLESAEHTLATDPGCAVVIGHLHERHPECSVYNRLFALEWSSPTGTLDDFGNLNGNMMVRLAVFAEHGGFRPECIAGEDSEFGVRLALAGHTVRKIDQPMATHDANMYRFRQWWRRSIRAGHAIGQRAHLHGASRVRDCARERRSTWFWGILLPLLVLLTLWPTRGWSALLLGGYVWLGWRIYRFRRKRGDTGTDSWLYAGYTLLGKFANTWGLLKFFGNQYRGRFRLIEYK